MLPIEPTPPIAVSVDVTARVLRGALAGALLGTALSISLLLGVQALQRRAAMEAYNSVAWDQVELRDPVPQLRPARGELPPCPALHRCPALRAHPELLDL